MGFDEGELRDESQKIAEATTAFVVLFDHLLDALLGAAVGGQRAFLGEGGGMRGGVALNRFDRLGQNDRGGHVAEAPSSHGIRFAESVDGQS